MSSYLLDEEWKQAKEEISEILYKWGRFLLDHGKYSEGLSKFWELYEKFPKTRWHTQVFEELVALEQPEDMVFVQKCNFLFGEGDKEREVSIASYFIDIYPVTNIQYLDFVKDTGCQIPIHWIGNMYPIGKAHHPVVWISAEDALAYACWRRKRLPTETEWERAARGPKGWKWAWGNQYESRHCNCRDSGIGDTTTVGSYTTGRSPYNCYDMAGNVWEWTMDWYDSNKSHRVLRGGSWFSFAEFTSASYRNFDFPGVCSGLYGFRCAKDFSRPYDEASL